MRQIPEQTDYGFIHGHTKAPDVAAHAKDPRAKRAVIEALAVAELVRAFGLCERLAREN
ncbi:hypothetical protein [Solidesulfovibrio sp. C21]|uniref:hypothetical protein n=1 Tax=Solidesulfovibrio sp. C21 TaxID=3398613 RepID=UPI0039FC1B86